MANYSQLKQSVKNVIKQNGQQEITGDVLQSVLISMITNLGMGDLYAGLAIPSTNPGTPDSNVFYIAVQQGTYTNFGGLTVGANDGLTILAYNGTWTKRATGTAMKTDITGVKNQITQLNTKITAAKNLIQHINANIEETAAVNLGITYSELSTKVQSGDIKALQDSNGSLYGVIVSDGTLYAYCQVSIVDGAYPLAGARYILTDAGSGNIKIERDDEIKLPYLDGNNKIHESMLPDNINTLKSKARYEYSLSRILALTDTSGESAVEEAFTPTYDPEGSLAPRVPKAGDLLIDGNNTVVVSEGTQIFFSFTYQEEIISMRVYGGGSSFRFNVWKFPAGTVYDFNSIDTLTESSTADDIKKALTPKIGDGMRIPNSGDIMLIGIEENPDTVSVLYRYRNTFAYYYNRLLTTIEVNGEDDSLSVVKTVSKNYVYDFDKINSLTNSSNFSDILHAFSPLIMGVYTLLPKTGDLLTSGYDEAGDAARSAKVIYHNGNSFAYCYDGKHVTVELVGELGNPDMRVEKTVTDLAGTGYEPRKYDYDKVMGLTTGSNAEDIAAAFTPIGGGAMEWPMPGDLLVSTDDRNHSMFLTNTRTTKSNAPVFLQILNMMTNAGPVIHVIGIRGGTAVASAYDIELDKEVESSDVVRLTAALEEGQSVDIGMTFSELKEKKPTFIIDANNLLFYCFYIDANNLLFTTMTIPPLENDKNSVGFNEIIALTDAGSGKVNIFVSEYSYKVPVLGSDGKIPAALLPDSAKELLFRDLWDDTCGSYGKYNTETGFYELNGLTDITYEQALAIYNSGMFSPIGGSVETRQYCDNTRIRTNLPYRGISRSFSGQMQNFRLMFFNCTSIETIRLMRLSDYSESQRVQVGNNDMMFYGCTKLRNVYTVLIFGQASSTSNAFFSCSALEEIRISGLKASLSFKDSPNLSKESILYLIQNSAATSAITVTLHPTAYAMATADTDIQAALQQKTLVSLAQAETA